MKFIKKCIFIISMFILLILIETTMYKKTIAITGEEEKIIVTGTLLDSKNNPVEGVTITFKSEDGSEVDFITKDNGEYYGAVLPGDYSISYDLDNSDTKSIKLTQYKKYIEDLELAFVYTEDLKEKVQLFNNASLTEGIFRRIENVYTNDINDKIHQLQRNTSSDNSFHEPPYIEGNESIVVVLTDEDKNTIKDYIDTQLSNDYTKYILGKSSLVKDIVKVIYGKENIIDTINKKSINETDMVEINSVSVIDIVAKITPPEDPPGGGDLPIIDGPSNYISGTIYKTFSTSKINVGNGVKVLLKNETNTTIASATTDDNGKYNIGYPGPGTYKLEFDFNNIDDITLQYYEASNHTKITEGCVIDNCLKLTDESKNKIDEYNDYYINYEFEEKLDNNIQGYLKGESEQFEIKGTITDTNTKNIIYDSKEHLIVANVELKEREKFSLTVNQDVHQYKIVLSNGQIFKQYQFDKNNPEHQHYRNLRLFNITMDTKLSYGAKLYVEYKITVTNNSNIDCTDYTILSRFENLEYNENQYLLSNSKLKNSNMQWKKVNKEEINTIIKGYNEIDSDTITFLKLEKNTLKNGQSDDYYVTLTRALDAEDGSTIFNGVAELIKYKNNQCRRNYSDITPTGNSTDYVIKAGNYFNNNSKIREPDTALSEDIAILPPTGFDLKTMCLLIVSTIVCIISFKHLINNKLYINIKKKRIKKKLNRF